MNNKLSTGLVALLPDIREAILTRRKPILWSLGDGFGAVDIGPNLILTLTAPSNEGKSALSMQWAFNALYLNPSLRVMIANCEMPTDKVIEREISRQAKVYCSSIHHRTFRDDDEKDKIEYAIEKIAKVADRIRFFNDDNITTEADELPWRAMLDEAHNTCDLLIIDYLQTYAQPPSGMDERTAINNFMRDVKMLANNGKGIIIVSSVNRLIATKKTRSDADMMASGSGSSGIEYKADNQYFLSRKNDDDGKEKVQLRQTKSRYGQRIHLSLRHIPHFHTFEVIPGGLE